jgi:hypothetical protein
MFGFKTIVAAVTVATMIGSSAFAADGALAPGKPAGVKTAQIGTGTLLIAGAAVAVIAAVAIVVSNQSGDKAAATNTFAAAATGNTAP